jgi:hypothetical protein
MKWFIKSLLLFSLTVQFLPGYGLAEGWDPKEITRLVHAFKGDDRGPFKAIRWFCPDGTVIAPDQRCPKPGGIQHGLHKDAVSRLAAEHGIYLGQILAGTQPTEVLDAANDNSRLKQYQLEKYLQLIDDGWIFRKARYYRGAVQSEDEETWGRNFFKAILADDETIRSQFFLLHQAAKDIPHHANDERWRSIRARAKTIADAFPPFSTLRIKLHGQPEHSDIQAVKNFRSRYKKELPEPVDNTVAALIAELETAYQPAHLQALGRYVDRLPSPSSTRTQLSQLLKLSKNVTNESVSDAAFAGLKIKAISDLLWTIRKEIISANKPASRLLMLDLSIELESLLYQAAGDWETPIVLDLLEKVHALGTAAAGCGFLEEWEWERIEPALRPPCEAKEFDLETFMEKADAARRIVEWGTGMVRAHYGSLVEMFSGFEPLTAGFIDDRIHASPLLSLGQTAGTLAGMASRYNGISSRVMGIADQHRIRGINPGFAVGRLEVIAGLVTDVAFSSDTIYTLPQAPADLKPVAGLLTVSEGNLVSHVQLLARNLGIPNAVLSMQNLNDLKPYRGKQVFYAVSPRGTVLMKPAAEMTAFEVSLVEARRKKEEKITVPTAKIDLKQVHLIALKTIRASDSGKVCGPKAANLGQLKNLFPDRVVDGLIVPFGIFRQHMDQPMPESDLSYWQFVQETFAQAASARKNGKSDAEIEAGILIRLDKLRRAVRNITFSTEFQKELDRRFQTELDAPMGTLPVFIRSDTNMEDLKDFSGAGLNLTVFNVLDKNDILQAIRDVWSSPYSERSYRWRQKYLLNPEAVYPSILLLPSVNVEKSGVMITTGVTGFDTGDTTVAFNRGVGGAVEGQAAESYLLKSGGKVVLLSPSRELRYTLLPTEGGVRKLPTRLNHPILNGSELKKLEKMAAGFREKLPGAPGIETRGPFDVELGFKDGELRLFQVRPYVENRQAQASGFLRSLDPKMSTGRRIDLNDRIEN